MIPREHQAGSIPLTILVVIIVGGVVAALFGIVRTGTQSTGRDRDFAAAIQLADAGTQEAYLILLGLDEEDLDTNMEPCPRPDGLSPGQNSPDSGICASGDGEFDDGGYVFEYVRVADSRNWQVRSWGGYRDNTRLVTSNIGATPLFTTALLARDDLKLNGLGTSVTGSNCQIDPFSVGSGGQITFTGQTSNCIKAVRVFNEPFGSTVPGSNFGGFDASCAPGEMDCSITFSLPSDLVLEDTARQAFDTGVCAGKDDELPRNGAGQIQLERTVYCVDSTTSFGSNDQVVIEDGDGTTTVYVNGDLFFNTQASVNAGEGDEAGDLLFDVAGSNVIIQGTAEVRAAIFAPSADCESNGGSGEFHGAMTCAEITINGNWRYDASVEDIEGSAFGIRNWAEAPPSGGPPIPIELGR